MSSSLITSSSKIPRAARRSFRYRMSASASFNASTMLRCCPCEPNVRAESPSIVERQRSSRCGPAEVKPTREHRRFCAVLPKGFGKTAPAISVLRVRAAKRRVGKRDALAAPSRCRCRSPRHCGASARQNASALQRDLRAEQNKPLVPDVERVARAPGGARMSFKSALRCMQRLVVMRQHARKRRAWPGTARRR